MSDQQVICTRGCHQPKTLVEGFLQCMNPECPVNTGRGPTGCWKKTQNLYPDTFPESMGWIALECVGCHVHTYSSSNEFLETLSSVVFLKGHLPHCPWVNNDVTTYPTSQTKITPPLPVSVKTSSSSTSSTTTTSFSQKEQTVTKLTSSSLQDQEIPDSRQQTLPLLTSLHQPLTSPQSNKKEESTPQIPPDSSDVSFTNLSVERMTTDGFMPEEEKRSTRKKDNHSAYLMNLANKNHPNPTPYEHINRGRIAEWSRPRGRGRGRGRQRRQEITSEKLRVDQNRSPTPPPRHRSPSSSPSSEKDSFPEPFRGRRGRKRRFSSTQDRIIPEHTNLSMEQDLSLIDRGRSRTRHEHFSEERRSPRYTSQSPGYSPTSPTYQMRSLGHSPERLWDSQIPRYLGSLPSSFLESEESERTSPRYPISPQQFYTPSPERPPTSPNGESNLSMSELLSNSNTTRIREPSALGSSPLANYSKTTLKKYRNETNDTDSVPPTKFQKTDSSSTSSSSVLTTASVVSSTSFKENLPNCPVCFSCYFNTKILQCMNGHSFCETCSKSFTKCPVCRVALSLSIRNHEMESMMSLLASLQVPDIPCHERFTCFCGDFFREAEFKDHINKVHGGKQSLTIMKNTEHDIPISIAIFKVFSHLDKEITKTCLEGRSKFPGQDIHIFTCGDYFYVKTQKEDFMALLIITINTETTHFMIKVKKDKGAKKTPIVKMCIGPETGKSQSTYQYTGTLHKFTEEDKKAPPYAGKKEKVTKSLLTIRTKKLMKISSIPEDDALSRVFEITLNFDYLEK